MGRYRADEYQEDVPHFLNVKHSDFHILVQPFNGWNIRFITSANIIAYERILTSGGATKADKLKWKDLGENLDDLFQGITHVIILRKESFQMFTGVL